MKKAASFAFAAFAAMTLAACGSSDKASEPAEAENVEMPAEEAMGNVDATPVADSAATATDAAATDASAAASDAVATATKAASDAAPAAPAPATTAAAK